jgi:hypothetical protein
MTEIAVATLVGAVAAGQVAPFALVRAAALPYGLLQALSPPRTAGLVAAAAAARRMMASKRERLENALYRAIPSADQRQRALLITIKRDIHNGRPPRCSPETIDRIAASLSPIHGADLHGWVHAATTATDAESDAETTLGAEIETHLRPRLQEASAADALRRPLVLASPALTTALCGSDRRHGSHGPTKRERSLIAYLARAAAKTSPFSAFMHSGLLELNDSDACAIVRLPEHARRTRAYVNRGAIHALLSAALREPSLALPLAFHRTASWDGDALCVLAPRYVAISRRCWRMERPSRARLHPAIANALRSLPQTFSRGLAIEALTAIGVADLAAARLVDKLIDAGALVAAIDLDAFTERPEDTLHDVLVRCGCPAAAEAIDDLSRAAAGLATADVPSRVTAVAAAHGAFARAATVLGASTAPADDVNLILEDGYYEHPLGAAGSEIVKLAAEIGAVLRPRLVERSEYARLRAALIAAGGVSRDVPRFLAQVCEGPDGPGAPSMVPPPPGTVPVAVTAQLWREPGSGRLAAVLNHLHTGGGALSARWAFGSGEFHQRLRAQLSAWIRRAAAGREPVDVAVCGECNPLQAHPRLTERVLTYLGEPSAAGASSVRLTDLMLAHDSETGAIELLDDGNRRLQPVYLGATVLGPAAGPAFWLTVIGRRYDLDLPGVDSALPAITTTCVHRPRRCAGRVVLRRSAWRIGAERIRAVWLRRTGAGRLIDVAVERDACGIPPVVFARAALGGESVFPDRARHKPLWIDTLNPFCLDLLERLAEGSRCVELTEVLPEPADAWPAAEGGARATEVLFELMV